MELITGTFNIIILSLQVDVEQVHHCLPLALY